MNIKHLPSDQLHRVLSQDECDIDAEFLGFTDVYDALAAIVPHYWTIVDLGCAYAPQAFIFRNHKAYIGVDIFTGERFVADNTVHYTMRISDFIEQHLSEFDQELTFAICSYVPPWGVDNSSLARQSFKNVFTYYPARDPGMVMPWFRKQGRPDGRDDSGG